MYKVAFANCHLGAEVTECLASSINFPIKLAVVAIVACSWLDHGDPLLVRYVERKRRR